MAQIAADERLASTIDGRVETRDASVDSLRFVCFLAVATLHVVTSPQRDVTQFAIIDHLTRFAVPIFFMMSGHFFEKPGAHDIARIIPRAKRLLLMFGFWEVVYNVVNLFVLHTADYPSTSIKLVYYLLYYSSGPAYHLWFLPHLVVTVFLFAILRRFGFRVLLPLAGLFYLAGLLLGPWVVLAGPDAAPLSVGVRNELFFGLPFFVLGAWLRDAKIDASMPVLLGGMAFGVVLQMFEGYAISRLGVDSVFAPHDFLLGTALFSLSVFLIFRKLDLYGPTLAKLGRISAGIFCVHILFLNLFTAPASPFFIDDRYVANENYATAFVVFALTVGCSIVVTLLMARVRALQPVVR